MKHEPERLVAFAALLREDIAAEIQNLRTALNAGDRTVAALSAHTLKGLCSHLRDRRPMELAMRLQAEAEAPSSDLPGLQVTAARMQDAYEIMIAAAQPKVMQ